MKTLIIALFVVSTTAFANMGGSAATGTGASVGAPAGSSTGLGTGTSTGTTVRPSTDYNTDTIDSVNGKTGSRRDSGMRNNGTMDRNMDRNNSTLPSRTNGSRNNMDPIRR